MPAHYDAILRVRSKDKVELDARLLGKIYGDTLTTGAHPFKDGEPVSASRVKFIDQFDDEMIVTTKSGTRYLIQEDQGQ